MNVVVFTGTREGMTKSQSVAVFSWLWQFRGQKTLFFHGGCEGADWEFHCLLIAHKMLVQQSWSIRVYPSDNYDSYPPAIRQQIVEGFGLGPVTDLAVESVWLASGASLCAVPQKPLDRNETMVNAARSTLGRPSTAEFGLATPKETEEQQRSGTWFTVRRLRRAHISTTIIVPDGSFLAT